MDKCPCLPAAVTVSGNRVEARVLSSGNAGGAVSVGNVVIRDGSNNYEELTNKPSIEGTTLVGDKTLPDIGVNVITPQEIDLLIYG